MKLNYLFILLLLISAISCEKKEEKETTDLDYPNTPAEGFNMAGSDERAMAIADEVMLAMGGRKNWDETRTLCWNFFGSRELVWDKWTGDVRIESLRDTTTYLLNLNTMEGKVSKNGVEVTDPELRTQLLDRGKRIWINDSYWLVMPFKLKDTGVTLKYSREDTTMSGLDSDVLQLTFKNVGSTPQNKYEVWVSKDERLVRQWYYFPTDTSEARIKSPWDEYRRYSKIMLSGNRGERALTNIMVLDKLPEEVYTSFEPIDLSKYLND